MKFNDDVLRKRSILGILFLLYLFAGLVRTGVILAQGLNSPLESDAASYFTRGENLMHGQGFSRVWEDGVVRPTAKQMPGTSLILGVGVLLFGDRPGVAHLLAAAFSSFSAPLMYLFALQVFRPIPALLSGLACAIYPAWLFYSTTAFSEPFFVPLLLLAMLLSCSVQKETPVWYAFVAGLAWGTAGMVRPHAVPMAGLVAVLLLCWGAGWRRAILLGTGCLLILAPWVWRNQRVFGKPLLATESGETLLGANNPYVLSKAELHGLWLPPRQIPEYWAIIGPIHDELLASQLQNQMARKFLRENPGAIPRLVVYKLARWLTPISETPGLIRLLIVCSYGSLLLFLLLGFSRRIYSFSFPLAMVLLWTMLMLAVTAVYWGNLVRGRLPLELPWLPWGIQSGWSIYERVARRTIPVSWAAP